MPALKRLQWSVDIAAPAQVVYQALIGPESYTKVDIGLRRRLLLRGFVAAGPTDSLLDSGGVWRDFGDRHDISVTLTCPP